MVKSVSIFGSTGSIGVNTLKVIQKNPEKFRVEMLLANSNFELLAEQALVIKPNYVCIVDESKLEQLKALLQNSGIKILAGVNAANELAKIKVDLAMMAIVGAAAIAPTIEIIKAGNDIAMANKECLVCAGNIIMSLAKQYNVKIIPVDSEHNGLFQVFDHKQPALVKDVTLTASGGPFRNYSLEQMQLVTKQQALKHPNWAMGAKISIDSATLVNKCLEVIEAYHLFPLKAEQIKIVIHPESIIHALVTYTDGSILSQLSKPNMQIPISYALHYPTRAVLDEFNQFDLAELGKLSFDKPDKTRFRSLKILDSLLYSIDSNASLVFNVANEVAVAAFLNDQISFIQITEIIEKVLNHIESKKLDDIEEVIEQIALVKQIAEEKITWI
jgi:1-deoxy-D-xylulose-5-phosphate reductoisomerase